MKTTLAITLLLLAFAAAALADAPRLKNERLDEGRVTVLTLDETQLLTVRTKRVVFLTAPQRAQLNQEAGVAPTVLDVYSTKALRSGIHGCLLFNFAHWFAPNAIEVPHSFLVSDDQAIAKTDELDEF